MGTELPTCENKHTVWGNRSMCVVGMEGNSVSSLEDLAIRLALTDVNEADCVLITTRLTLAVSVCLCAC